MGAALMAIRKQLQGDEAGWRECLPAAQLAVVHMVKGAPFLKVRLEQETACQVWKALSMAARILGSVTEFETR